MTSPRAPSTQPQWRGALLVAPAVVPTLVVLVAGLAAAALQSLGLMPLVGQPHLSLSAYTAPGSDLAAATGLSLSIATASTVLAAAIGLGAALSLAATAKGSRLLAAASALPVPLPHLVGAASIGLLLADSGLLARLLHVPATAWPALVGGRWPIAIVAEYTWKESAFITLVVAAAMVGRVASYTETATLLGAGRWARLRHVTLPLAAPALLASSAITFVYALGSYEVAWLLGRAYPEPLPVMAYRLFTSNDLAARPQAMAVALTTTALAGATALLCLSLLRRMAAWR